MSDGQLGKSWQRAISVAARWHSGQTRLDGVTPYVAHPMRVALVVRDLFGEQSEAILCAAVLHDLLEDTTADYEDILEGFGASVANMVAELTKDSKLPEAERERHFYRSLSSASRGAKIIKLADVYDNVCDSPTSLRATKARERARRVLRSLGSDARVSDAVAIVRELIG